MVEIKSIDWEQLRIKKGSRKNNLVHILSLHQTRPIGIISRRKKQVVKILYSKYWIGIQLSDGNKLYRKWDLITTLSIIDEFTQMIEIYTSTNGEKK
ncbi:hypothetical protein M0812_28421 [Anaeramoeba flamelloides]|uniref:Uncharacterized protein n=1 Tax=Anaeramoeba flamelloides TaxID=1746091 RepID=A0AAV7YBG6_9EUKA|nr:hypothetical protein M0812_28421 [Anaeramoeba flamelloides]